MAAFTYSYSNSLGETLSTAGIQFGRASNIYKPHTVILNILALVLIRHILQMLLSLHY